MEKFRSFVRKEMKVEFFACTHGVSMIFIYGLLGWLDHTDSVPFVKILCMMILGYVISWIQNLLFMKEEINSQREYRLRAVLWNMLPILLTFGAGELLGWFSGHAYWVRIWFDIIMIIYFVMVWFFLNVFFKEDSDEMTWLLKQYKKEKLKKD